LRLRVGTPRAWLDDVALGDSIALNGACMTVVGFDSAVDLFSVDVSTESLQKTAGLADAGSVNLEKALRANDRLGGHLVSGHVDGVGHVCAFTPVGESRELRISAPLSLARYLAYKGSIAVNGVSLTVNRVFDQPQSCEISINLIPHTLASTTLGSLQPGQDVNLEIDTVARYVERMLSAPGARA
jgi:riboflavin synthase